MLKQSWTNLIAKAFQHRYTSDSKIEDENWVCDLCDPLRTESLFGHWRINLNTPSMPMAEHFYSETSDCVAIPHLIKCEEFVNNSELQYLGCS